MKDLQIDYDFSNDKHGLIALVNVPYGARGQSMRPLGLTSLGSYLTANGITSTGYDFSDSKLPPEDLVDKYKLFEYPMVGLSVYNINARLAFRMARAIKARRSNCLVVGGGPHISATSLRLFDDHPEIDIAVLNEGEETLFELISALRENKPLRTIKGITYHDNGTKVISPPRDRIKDLDGLSPLVYDFVSDSPANELFFFDMYANKIKRATALVSSRGCPYDCSFCAIILIGRQWRGITPQKVVADLATMENHHQLRYEHIYFLDANFFVSEIRALEITKELHRYRPEMTFSFSTRVDQLIRGKDMLPELKEMGLRAVELGVESGSDAALKRFGKGTTIAQNEEALRLLAVNNIQLILDFIMFDAEADLRDIEFNLDFLERNSLDDYVPWDHIFSNLTPYIGTAIRNHYEHMLGMKFDLDQLPEPQKLLINDNVRQVFLELYKLLEYLPKLKHAISETENRISNLKGADAARHKLNVVTLRRLPFIVLRNLCSQAHYGQEINFEGSLPTFIDDEGYEYDLKGFLKYALQ